MKAVSQDLFILLKSLSKGEKSFLSKFIKINSKKDESSIMKLLEAIDKQNQYDEDKLIDKLEISKNNFAVLKSQATGLVMDAIFMKETASSEKGKLYKSLVLAEHFLKKGHYEWTEKICKETLDRATELGYHAIAIEAEDLKNKVCRYELHLDKIASFCEKKNIFNHLKNLEQALWLRHYYDAISATILQDPSVKSDYALDQIAKAQNFAKSVTETVGLENERLFLQMRLMISSGLRNISSLKLMKDTLQIFEKNPVLLRENFNEYLMFNILFYYLYTKLGDKKSLDIQCERLQKIAESPVIQINHVMMVKTRVQIQIFQLSFCFENGLFDTIDKTIQPYEEYFLENENVCGSLDYMWFCHLASMYYFVVGELDKAHHWIYKQIHSKFYAERQITHVVTRMYLIFLHYDMKNYDYLRHEIHNTKRYLTTRNLQDQIEYSIIKAMLEAIETPNPKHIFAQLKKTLEEKQVKRYLTVNVIDHFNFVAWLDSKISGKSFRETSTLYKPFFLRFFRPLVKLREELPEFMTAENHDFEMFQENEM